MRLRLRFICAALVAWLGWSWANASQADAQEATDTATSPPKAAPSADPIPTGKAPPKSIGTDETEVSPETKAQARRRFLKGLALLREQAWAPALAEFLASRELYATRVATNNAGIALRKLERYDEALDMFETLLRDFKVSDAEREDAQREIAELRALVGTVDIQGAEPGASIVISSQDRGEYPPVKPIRVPAGNHVVRVFKEGFEPFETRVDVAGGKTAVVEAKLAKLTASGRLRVSERSGKQVDVLVDNVVVGQAPWEGLLGVGDHMVMLRGQGKLGSQPTLARVRSEQRTQLALVVEELESSLRVDPTPPGASVWINSVNVGNGVWLGRLKAATHTVEVKAEGFVSETREVVLGRGKRERLEVVLERDEDAPMWKKPSKWTIDVGVSALIAPTLGGDVATSCKDGCSNRVGVGGLAVAHGSYELGSGLGFGIELGGLLVSKQVVDREAALEPVGFSAADAGTAEDDLRLAGFLVGAAAGYHVGDQVPFTARLGAGALVGQIRDERRGRFGAQNGGDIDAFPVADFASATYFYLDPTLRLGFRFADQWEVAGQLQALLLIGISQPRWDSSVEIGAGSDGVGRYPDERLMGSFVVLPALGVNIRYTIGGETSRPSEGVEAKEVATEARRQAPGYQAPGSGLRAPGSRLQATRAGY